MIVEEYWSHSFVPALVSPAGVVLDIGVNSGGFSKLMAACCSRVIGYEADPKWKERLRLPSNVEIHFKAVAARPGALSLHVNTSICSSLHYSDVSSEAVTVEAITLEDAVAETDVEKVDLLKMDIEGEEVPVLLSASDAVLKRISQITVEFHDFLDPSLLPNIKRVIHRLKSLGFAAFRFSLRNHGDMLFINTEHHPLSSALRFWILLRYKYCRGLGRMIRRTLERGNGK